MREPRFSRGPERYRVFGRLRSPSLRLTVMSSGRNWIPIRGKVGRTRKRLAELITDLTGWAVDPERIQRTNPTNQHWEDCCAWDVWCVGPNGVTAHVYSWSTMKDCVKHGIARVEDRDNHLDLEITANR